jgi:hypothetical protein
VLADRVENVDGLTIQPEQPNRHVKRLFERVPDSNTLRVKMDVERGKEVIELKPAFAELVEKINRSDLSLFARPCGRLHPA